MGRACHAPRSRGRPLPVMKRARSSGRVPSCRRFSGCSARVGYSASRITAAFIAVVLLAIVLPATRAATRIPPSWHFTPVAVVFGATVPALLAGFAVMGSLPGGLNWLAFAVLFALCAATSNAWVLLVEVVRDERYSPVD